MPHRVHLPLPVYADTVVVGGGTSGAVLAARLAAESDRTVLLLEAGPDYGPFAGGGWPSALIDARSLPFDTHDWRYTSAARHGAADLRLERARVLGGCSAHNGCIAIWGSRVDYDGWVRLGNAGWGTEALLPWFHDSNERLSVRRPVVEDVTPWHRAVLDASPGIDIPLVDNLNDLDQHIGASTAPANISQGVRWNTAFGYLDPVRERPNLTILGDVTVDRVLLERGRVAGLAVVGPDGPAHITTSQVVLCAGAYGSPAMLLRSGIGAPQTLRATGIECLHALTGVGENLHDHPALQLSFSGTPELIAAMEAFGAGGRLLYTEQSILKARSAGCAEAFDLHIYAEGGRAAHLGGAWAFTLNVAVMDPRSRGTLRLASRNHDAAPIIDHGYLTDPEDHDLAVLLNGVELARGLAAQPPLAALIGEELRPGPSARHGDALRAYARAQCVHYFHPVGTCKMGQASDPRAVVDADGQVHGLDGLFVADASIVPVIPRANTNIPCVVVGEKIAAGLLARP